MFGSKVHGNSTQVLRDLEISLRTNPIEWVQEFLDVSTNNGLDVMIKYLSSLLCVMKQTELQHNSEDSDNEAAPVFDDKASTLNGSQKVSVWGSIKPSSKSSSLSRSHNYQTELDKSRMSNYLRQSAKLKRDFAPDDVNLCIMCLRAIMNNKYGFNMVIAHKEAINCLALSLVRQMRVVYDECCFWASPSVRQKT